MSAAHVQLKQAGVNEHRSQHAPGLGSGVTVGRLAPLPMLLLLKKLHVLFEEPEVSTTAAAAGGGVKVKA